MENPVKESIKIMIEQEIKDLRFRGEQFKLEAHRKHGYFNKAEDNEFFYSLASYYKNLAKLAEQLAKESELI